MGSWTQSCISTHAHVEIDGPTLNAILPPDTFKVQIKYWNLDGKIEYTLTEETTESSFRAYNEYSNPRPDTLQAAAKYIWKREPHCRAKTNSHLWNQVYTRTNKPQNIPRNQIRTNPSSRCGSTVSGHTRRPHLDVQSPPNPPKPRNWRLVPLTTENLQESMLDRHYEECRNVPSSPTDSAPLSQAPDYEVARTMQHISLV